MEPENEQINQGFFASVTPPVISKVDLEWGEHKENEEESNSWDNLDPNINAKKPKEPFIVEDFFMNDNNKLLRFFTANTSLSTSSQILKLESIYIKTFTANIEFAMKLNNSLLSEYNNIVSSSEWNFMDKRSSNMSLNLSLSKCNSDMLYSELKSITSTLERSINKFNQQINLAENYIQINQTHLQSLTNILKTKLRNLTSTENFTFNFKGSSTISTYNDFVVNSSIKSYEKSPIDNVINRFINKGSSTFQRKEIFIKNGQKYTDVNNPFFNNSDNFDHYFTNRFENYNNILFKLVQEDLNGRSQSVCNFGKINGIDSDPLSLLKKKKLSNITVKNKYYYDFNLSVDVIFREQTNVGISFRVKDEYNYYAFFIDTYTRYRSIVKVINNKPYVLMSVKDGGILIGVWNTVNINVTMGNIEVIIYESENTSNNNSKNNKRTMKIWDTSFSGGSVGFVVDDKKGFCFDKLKIISNKIWTSWKPKQNFQVIPYTSNYYKECKFFNK